MDYGLEIFTVLEALHQTVVNVSSVMVFGIGFISGCLLLTAFSFWKW